MNAASVCLTACLLVTFSAGSAARADHRLLRQLDETTAHMLEHAREARWIIDDRFTGSRDYAGLRQDSRELTKALRNVEDAIYFERAPRAILSLVHEVHDVLTHFEEHVTHSDFHRGPSRSGYTRTPGRPAGHAHLAELTSVLKLLHSDVDAMIALLEPAAGVHRHDHGTGAPFVPPYRVQPSVPSPGPVFPGVHAPEQSASSKATFPPVRSRSGDVLLRLLLD